MDIPDVVVYDRATWKDLDERDEDEKAGYPFSGDASDLYVALIIPDEDTFDKPCLCVVVERRDAWVPTGSDVGMFRPLSRMEVEQFKASARQQFESGNEVNPLWHPVVRREMALLAAKANLRAVGLDDSLDQS